MTERLYHFEITDHFVDKGGLFGAHLALLFEHGIGAGGDKLRREQGERGDEKHDEGDFPTQHEQYDEHAQNGGDPREELVEREEQAVRELFGVRDDDARRLAIGSAVEISEGQDLDLAEGGRADVRKHMIDDLVAQCVHAPLRKSRDRHAPADRKENPIQAGKKNVVLPENAVYAEPRKIGNGERRRHVYEREKDGERKQKRIRFEI